MGANDYAYAVARIRVLEKGLLKDSDIEQMIAMADASSVKSFLAEKGWGRNGSEESADDMLRVEEDKIYDVIKELKVDPEIFDIFSYADTYHNLKAAIKSVCTKDEEGIFAEGSAIEGDEMMRIVRERDFKALPEHMQKAAEEAYEALLHTRDGQLCDIIIDKAALEAIEAKGKGSKEDMIRDWASQFVAVSDIRAAVRAAKTGKSRDFIDRCLADSSRLDKEKLCRAAATSVEECISYLESTEFSDAARAVEESPSAFERWCDNAIIEKIKPQRRNPFTAGPVIAYYLARLNEIKMARILLTAKANDLSEDAIRQRARAMYV